MIEIDGSHGEGGGQIIRTSVALSAVTGKNVKISNIRARRKKPGLQAQHKTAIDAVAKLCNANVIGNRIGGEEIIFEPKKIKGGLLTLHIGTAGSTALVLQSLMIPAMHTEKPLDVTITGGTINTWAPSAGYLQNVAVPLLKKFGYKGEIELKKHGFYPTGGGLVEARIRKCVLERIDLTERGKIVSVNGLCTATEDLQKQQVAERMQKYLRGKLFDTFQVAPNIKTSYVESASSGGGCDLFAVYEDSILGAVSVAERGKRSEDVAKEALEMLASAHKSGAALDMHMADQIVPYMALAGGVARVEEITEHCKTNIWVCEQFLGLQFDINEEKGIIACEK